MNAYFFGFKLMSFSTFKKILFELLKLNGYVIGNNKIILK